MPTQGVRGICDLCEMDEDDLREIDGYGMCCPECREEARYEMEEFLEDLRKMAKET